MMNKNKELFKFLQTKRKGNKLSFINSKLKDNHQMLVLWFQILYESHNFSAIISKYICESLNKIKRQLYWFFYWWNLYLFQFIIEISIAGFVLNVCSFVNV